MLSRFVSTRFQVLFHSPSGVLFTFPSRYSFTIGHQRYLALRDGPRRFPPNSTCSVVLGIPHREIDRLSPTGLPPCIAGRSMPFG